MKQCRQILEASIDWRQSQNWVMDVILAHAGLGRVNKPVTAKSNHELLGNRRRQNKINKDPILPPTRCWSNGVEQCIFPRRIWGGNNPRRSPRGVPPSEPSSFEIVTPLLSNILYLHPTSKEAMLFAFESILPRPREEMKRDESPSRKVYTVGIVTSSYITGISPQRHETRRDRLPHKEEMRLLFQETSKRPEFRINFGMEGPR